MDRFYEIEADERRGVRAALVAFDRAFETAGPGADDWATLRQAAKAALAAKRRYGWKSRLDVRAEEAHLTERLGGRKTDDAWATIILNDSGAAAGAAQREEP